MYLFISIIQLILFLLTFLHINKRKIKNKNLNFVIVYSKIFNLSLLTITISQYEKKKLNPLLILYFNYVHFCS